jgi:hypothetical protein
MHRNRKPVDRVCAILILIFAGSLGAANAADPPAISADRIPYGPPRQIATLKGHKVNESSGLAISRRRPDVLWTHNDSGDEPRIFAFDMKGEMLAACTVSGAAAVDWEDMASFTLDGKPYLLIADVGDNRRLRTNHKLYIVEEPTLDQKSVAVKQTIKFSYDDGPHDCEAVAVDTTTKTIYLCTKVLGLTCEVFQLEIPKDNNVTLVAKGIAKPAIAVVTSMAISPDGQRAILSTYGDAFEFVRSPSETWATAFTQKPRTIQLPERKQGETICYGSDGKTLYLTSEQDPTPLWEVPVIPR